jgi:Ca2+-binding RTX toxin-like protein
MPNVTVPGAHGSTVTLAFDSNTNAVLAGQVAAALKAGIISGDIVVVDSSSGPPQSPPAGKAGEFVQSQSGVTMLPKGFDYVVDEARSAIIYGSGDPGQTVLAGAGNLTFVDAAGGGSIITGGGDNQILIMPSDTGGWQISTGGGNDSIRALGSGADSIAAGGGRNLIQLGSGSSSIVTTGADTILAGSGSETITAMGSGVDSPVAHSGHHGRHGRGHHDREGGGGRTVPSPSDVVYGGSSQLVFIGAGAATVFGGSGSDTVIGDHGSELLYGGTGGNNFLQAGDGAATLFGGGSGDQLYAGGGQSQELHAGAGNETLFGGFASGNDTFYGGAGSDQIYGGFGNDTFVAGIGSATVTASPFSSNVFDFVKATGGGTEVVTGLTDASQVHIALSGYGAHAISQALASQSFDGSGVTITLSDNTKVTFQNITGLTAQNFVSGGSGPSGGHDHEPPHHSFHGV